MQCREPLGRPRGTVSLIFLDTPQIDLLEGVRRTDPVRYSYFRDAWRARGNTLVFTTTHASELRRYGDASRREGRYQVLADLAPLRTDVPRRETRPTGPRILLEREILRAMVERRLIKIIGDGADDLLEQWMNVLPGRLDAHEAASLRVNENEIYLNLANLGYDAARLAAAGAKHDGHRKKKKRVRDFEIAPIPAEKVLAYREEMEKATAFMEEQSRLGVLPPIPAAVLAASRRLGLEFLARMEEIGPRAALIERLPIVGFPKDELLQLTSDALVSRYCFELQVRTFAHEVLIVSESDQEFLARTLDLSDCPGFWLERRLELCVRHGCRQPRANHHYDLERLAYLPYVDLLLTDAEMAEFVRQVRNDESTPARIRDVRPPVAIPTSLDALEEVLGSLKPETSG